MRKVIIISTVILIIIITIILITKQVKEYYSSDPILAKLKEKIRPIFVSDKPFTGHLEKLNHINILDKIELYKGDKSYTIDKQKVFLCLKDENNEYYNMNMLVYVSTHELSHVICESVGHTEEFHNIFNELLNIAVKKGIYDPTIPVISDYCEY